MEIKSPWTMVCTDIIDEFVSFIKDNLPSKHELQSRDLFPGIKLSGQPIFIVDDDTTGNRLLIDFSNMTLWGKTNIKIPTIIIFENDSEIQEMTEHDHQKEIGQ